MHDIGIFAVPQQLLTKTGRLTQGERALVEQHPRLGREVIERLGKDYGWLADVVLQAHERGSGQGYPNRLKGREINELAQIIGLVDISMRSIVRVPIVGACCRTKRSANC